MEFTYLFDGQPIAVRVEKSGDGYLVTLDGQAYTVTASPLSSQALSLTINGERRLAFTAADGPRRWVAFDSQPFVLVVPQAEKRARRGKHGGHDSLEAQMPGVVRKVLAGAGDRVERGQVLLILEAMKMEIRVTAPHAGVVEKVLVKEGETVGRGEGLVELVVAQSVAVSV